MHEAETGALRVGLSPSLAMLLFDVVSGVRRLFDIDADILETAARLTGDTKLCRYLALSPGLRVPGAFDHFETAVTRALEPRRARGRIGRLRRVAR